MKNFHFFCFWLPQAWRDLVAVEIGENKIQWNDDAIRIAVEWKNWITSVRVGSHDPFLDPVIFPALFQPIEMLIHIINFFEFEQ